MRRRSKGERADAAAEDSDAFARARDPDEELLMIRDFILHEQLEQLRREQSRPREHMPLELPLPRPYWPEPEEERDDEADGARGVTIIDMNDYSEVDA